MDEILTTRIRRRRGAKTQEKAKRLKPWFLLKKKDTL